MIELGLVDVRAEDDVVRAHQTTRTVAAQLGFSTFEQTRIATATSEIARDALIYASGGSVMLGLDDDRQALTVVVIDRGPGIADVAAVLDGERRSSRGLGVGVLGAKRLMDTFAIESTSSGTRVEMTKRVPRRAGKVDAGRVGAMQLQLAGQLADEPSQEIRRLQRDVAERDHRMVELTEELTETNRGVMALYNELDDRAEYQRRAIELRTRLLSEMGHELRTDLTGFEVLEKLKADGATRNIPIVVYTALVLGADDRARLADAAAILRKSTSSRVADRAAIEDALVKAGVASTGEDRHA